MSLTLTRIKSATPAEKPYKLFDRDRMYLLVSVAGSKTWKWNYRLEGDRTATLGRWPDVSLAEARERRSVAARQVEKGIHPSEAKAEHVAAAIANKQNSFWSVVADWFEVASPKWSDTYKKRAEAYLTRYVRDTSYGVMPIRSVKASDIYTLLKGVAVRKAINKKVGERKATGAPAIAKQLRSWIDQAFRFGIATGRCEDNPAAAMKLRDVVAMPPTRHNAALKRNVFSDLLKVIDGYGGERATCIALDLLLLTMVRTGELRLAKWPEFDLDHALWSIPGERMKKRRPHVVPLSRQAVALLRELHTLTGTNPEGWLFPNKRDPNRPMGSGRLNQVFERSGFNGENWFRAHGTRGTSATALYESGFRSEVVESQLSHLEPNTVKRAYNQAQYLEERTRMLQAWADCINEIRSVAKEEQAA